MIDPFTLVAYGVKFDPLVHKLKEEGFDLWYSDKALGLNPNGIKRVFFVWQGRLVYFREGRYKTNIRYIDPKATNYSFIHSALEYFNIS